MFFAPSTLGVSYKTEDLEERVLLIQQGLMRFLQLTGQSLPITIHADFVFAEFATARKVSPSLGLEEYFSDSFDGRR